MATKAKSRKSQGISPAGKAAILAVIFGIPILFATASWGLSKLFNVAPYAVIGVIIVVATAYTAHTVSLMYDFYELKAPFIRFIPCICETALIDLKYHLPCYILYVLTLAFIGLSQLPYKTLSFLGEGIALNFGFYAMIIALLFLAVIQVIKGIGISGCLRDIGEDWKRMTHSDLGAITKLTFLGFLPFVRVVALYSLNKPLSTMVDFMGVSVDDIEDDNEDYYEEDEDED